MQLFRGRGVRRADEKGRHRRHPRDRQGLPALHRPDTGRYGGLQRGPPAGGPPPLGSLRQTEAPGRICGSGRSCSLEGVPLCIHHGGLDLRFRQRRPRPGHGIQKPPGPRGQRKRKRSKAVAGQGHRGDRPQGHHPPLRRLAGHHGPLRPQRLRHEFPGGPHGCTPHDADGKFPQDLLRGVPFLLRPRHQGTAPAQALCLSRLPHRLQAEVRRRDSRIRDAFALRGTQRERRPRIHHRVQPHLQRKRDGHHQRSLNHRMHGGDQRRALHGPRPGGQGQLDPGG
ncbi:MAG: hypothetical protein BWX71_01033 [Deltaproteobacteria bacterium ADurb.Bin072]|nr:MAG: hypothetical protein BWX71_01033 [Deltaproteobacteria bacterium ADurb.Bin072]